MSDTRWKIRLVRGHGFGPFFAAIGIPRFVGTKGHVHIQGDSIADVMNGIAYHEGEQP